MPGCGSYPTSIRFPVIGRGIYPANIRYPSKYVSESGIYAGDIRFVVSDGVICETDFWSTAPDRVISEIDFRLRVSGQDIYPVNIRNPEKTSPG